MNQAWQNVDAAKLLASKLSNSSSSVDDEVASAIGDAIDDGEAIPAAGRRRPTVTFLGTSTGELQKLLKAGHRPLFKENGRWVEGKVQEPQLLVEKNNE